MFTTTNDPEDTYFMDPCSSFFSPLNFPEFHDSPFQLHDPAWRAENIVSQPPAAGAGDDATSASNKMVSSKGDINEIEENARNNQGPPKREVSRKRSSKADRHSKIPTKNGLRDRRMRLSLDVARQFFKLQDMLIFDKPSKTVRWLLMQAKSAIEELKKGKKNPSTDAAKSTSSTSEGEFAESAVEEEIVNDVPKAAPNKEKSRKTRKTLCPAAKEMRKKAREEARERARERTQQKNQSRLLNDSCLDDVMNLYQCHLRPNGALGLGDEPVSQTHTMKPSLDILFEIEQDQRHHFRSTEGFIGSSSTVSTNWSPLTSINYHQEDDSFQANPISEFQFHGTSREPAYNPNLGHFWY